ncbi:MAG TPA: hypothetical protein VFX16_26335 [Pseudonocardiaceae bacterium]|nr:hypothetical protein [Pseudonocardiaceae bacterium]
MPAAVLTGHDDQLPDRWAALARYAALLTAQPWSITADIAADLTAHGLDPQAIQAATGVVAMFNYLTRVADASGIEFDYASPLPTFQPERDQQSVPRPDRESWPVITPDHRMLPGFPAMTEAWRAWREYVFDSDEPLTHRERAMLANAAAQECCDRWRADELDKYTPQDDRDAVLDTFARKLSRQPWRMGPADLQALRDTAYPEPALLHVISVVALQNAESRLAIGHGMTAG